MDISSPPSLLFIYAINFISTTFLLASAIFFVSVQKNAVLYALFFSIGVLIHGHPVGVLFAIVFFFVAFWRKNKWWVTFLEIGLFIIFLKRLFIFLYSLGHVSEETIAQYIGAPVDWVFTFELAFTILGQWLSAVSLYFLARELQRQARISEALPGN